MDSLRSALLPRMHDFVPALERLLAGLSEEERIWRPSDGGWSVVEIVGHLLDEEQGDFRPRLHSTIEDPERDWTPIDPEMWVVERRHQERPLEELLSTLREERVDSLRWLESLDGVDWNVGHEHPTLGRLTAGDLLASWATHDVVHLKQISNRLLQLVVRGARPHDPEYGNPGGA